MNERTDQWLAWDRMHCWHPFTEQGAWCDPTHEPLVIERGEGVWLWDSEGRKYFDGNASIWTNLHGHAHSEINAALTKQLQLISHSSYLGLANPRASELAARLCELFPTNTLERVFFSDDGSTAVECALKMALQYRMQTGEPERTRILAFDQAYHGDTMGAAALGGVSRFFERFRSFALAVDFIATADDLPNVDAKHYAAVVIEPIVQGVNQMRIWPSGMLRALREWCDAHDVHLIVDEVMTGFGRTGKLFACNHEQVIPDFLCLAKGLTGGYLPLAATLTTEKIYRAFLGKENIFYYGHSFTANQLGCAAALANLEILRRDYPSNVLAEKSALFGEILHRGLADLAQVYEVRHCGMLAGIELREVDGRAFSAEDGSGAKVCVKAREYGLITRPILDTIVLMPPLCSTVEELEFAVSALRSAIRALFFSKK